MKKYIAYSYNLNGGGGQNNSGITTLEIATAWAKKIVAASLTVRCNVCEVISTVDRPTPIVEVRPFVPEPEVPEIKKEEPSRLVRES